MVDQSDRRLNRLQNLLEVAIGDDLRLISDGEYSSDSLVVDFIDIYEFDRNIARDCIEYPDDMTEAFEKIVSDNYGSSVSVRIENLAEDTELGHLSSEKVHDLVQVRGVVSGMSSVKTAFVKTVHECASCGSINRGMLSDPKFLHEIDGPPFCRECDSSGPFFIIYESSEMVDTQSIVLEQDRCGQESKTVTIRLQGDVTGSVDIGDDVVVTGVLRLSDDLFDTTVRDKYIECMSISQQEVGVQMASKLSDDTIDDIRHISERETLYDDMIGSVAPAVSGHEREKLSLILQLFSGVRKQLPDGTEVRGDIHILMIGDPSTAKSALLRSAARLAPKSVVVSGTDTTQAGLTSSATPSSGNADPWEIKGGALVKADGGLAVLDNMGSFDSDEFSGLHSTLEYQEVNASKASVTKTLSAQSSVLGALNPKYGRFNLYEPIGDQLDLSPQIVSQFDLVFTLIDDPDPSRDGDVADGVLSKTQAGRPVLTHSADDQHDSDTPENAIDMVSPEIDSEMLRKYIAYAQSNVFPTLTDEAKEEIRDFYMNMRGFQGGLDDPVPVTARKLEAIVRLAEASARVRLSDTVELVDADRAISVVGSCLDDIGVNPENDQDDLDIIDTEPSEEFKHNVTAVKMLIQKYEGDYESGVPFELIVDKLTLSEETVEDVIEALRRKGDAYSPKSEHYRVT